MKPADKTRWPPPPGVVCWAQGEIQGIVHAHPVAQPNFCRAEIEVGEQLFPVFAAGDLAEQLGTLATGCAVRLTGALRQRFWPIGRGQERRTCCLDIEQITILARSPTACPTL